MHIVKMLDAERARIGGYLVVWGDPAHKDLHDEYFTPQTHFELDWYDARPVLFQHGSDRALHTDALGQIDTLRTDETGLWAEAQLDTHHRYWKAVRQLIDSGALNWSSGSLPHLTEAAPDGRIIRWPIVEGSLTPTPAEPRQTGVALKALRSDFIAQTQEQDATMTENMPTFPRKRLPVATEDANTSPNLSASPRIEVGSPYDRLDPLDLLHGSLMLGAARPGKGLSQPFANALAHKLRRAGTLSATKADELSHTAQSGYGQDWVTDLWSEQVWRVAREQNPVLGLFRQIEMPTSPFHVPVEGIDPTVYYVRETSDSAQLSLGSGAAIPASKTGSDSITLTAQKLALRVGFSAELVEDSLVPVLGIYREQAVRAISDSIDYVLLNGDTENIAPNVSDAELSADATSRFFAFDGLRKQPLVTTATNSLDFGSAPTLAKLRQVRFLMAMRHAARPSDLAWIVDGSTYAALLALPEFVTMDKAGSLATAITGQLGFLDGAPLIASGEMPLTRADGFIEIGGSNTKGTALCVYRPGWLVGYRRRMAVSVDYLPYHDAYQMTATVRLAFAPHSEDVAALGYNITV